MNKTHEWLEQNNKTLEDYDGLCVELAGDVAHALGGGVVYLSPVECGVDLTDTLWAFHAAALLDGVVHDGWCKDPLPLLQWIAFWAEDQEIELSHFTNGQRPTFGEGVVLRGQGDRLVLARPTLAVM